MKRKNIENITSSKRQKISYPKIDTRYWVKASGTRNYMLNDPLLDWLDMYYCEKTKNPYPKKDEFIEYIMEKGNRFETDVMNILSSKFSFPVEKIAEYYQSSDVSKYEKTIDLMKQQVPFIYQGLLYNYDNNTYGLPDLIVRSDYINKLVRDRALEEETDNDGNYYYVIVDIKWTTLQLCSDGIHILNTHNFPAYKGQLYIYNQALSKIQKYKCPKVFILGRRYNYTKCGKFYGNDSSCFDKLGTIDYSTKDKEFCQKTENAVKWIKRIRSEGKTMSFDPPSCEELYPNMANLCDSPWRSIKEKIANDIKEITLLWMCGYKNRIFAHNRGIKRWDDVKCIPKNININGPINGPILENILEINKQTKINIRGLNSKEKILKQEEEFFIDFETISGVFYDGSDPILSGKKFSGYVYMIGLGWEENKEWKYKNFTMENMSSHSEEKMMDEFMSFISLKNTKFYHWGNFENYTFRDLNKRHNNKWSFSNIKLINLLSIIKSYPIVVRGSFNFSLKSIAKAMKSHGMITSTWKYDCKDGQDAMMQGWKCYKEHTSASPKTSLDATCDILNNKDMQTIIKYNEIDCRVMWEILLYLRNM